MNLVEVVFHGHSFFEIMIEHGSILIDPYITGNRQCDVTIEDICKKRIIALCVTHGCQDHIGDTVTIKQYCSDIPVFTVAGVAKYLSDQGLTHCIGGLIGDTLHHEYFSVTLVVAHHDGDIEPVGGYTQPSGMIFSVCNKRIYHVGDSALTKDFELIGIYGTIDVLCIPIGGFYTMNVDDAVIACHMIQAKWVVPMHYNTFSDIKADPNDFACKVMLANCGIPKVLKAGQMIVL